MTQLRGFSKTGFAKFLKKNSRKQLPRACPNNCPVASYAETFPNVDDVLYMGADCITFRVKDSETIHSMVLPNWCEKFASAWDEPDKRIQQKGVPASTGHQALKVLETI